MNRLLLAALFFAPAAFAADRYAGLDTVKYLGALKVEITLPGEKNFTEGPAVDAEGNVFFTNPGEILKWEPAANGCPHSASQAAARRAGSPCVGET